METSVGKNASPVFKKQNPSKLWLVLPIVLGVCMCSLCAASGGLILWQSQVNRPEQQEAAPVPLRQNPAESLLSPTATPTSILTPSDSTTLLATLPSQTDTLATRVCPKIDPIGLPIVQSPALSSASFSTRQGEDGWPIDTALQFTTAVTRVLATFSYAGMSDGLNWERVWFIGDEELARGGGVWDAGPTGRLTVQAVLGEGGFAPGLYKLEIYVQDQLLSQGAFMVVKEDTPTQRPVQVAYTTWDGQKHQLHLLDLETSQTEPLVDYARSPAWSPDARDLLFYSEDGSAEGAGLQVFNMGQKKVSWLNQEPFFQSIAWSPNRIYAASAVAEGAGSRLVVWDLNKDQAFEGPAGEEPAWSPQGLRLAYRGCDEEAWHINTIQVIGSNFDLSSIRSLTAGDDSQPAWSWDGQRIAFVRREGDNQDIYVVQADGSHLVRLTDHPAADVSPAWTPDQRLVFRSLRDGGWGLYLMNADGSEQRHLISTPAPTDWQPDRLAVSTDVLVAEPPQPPVQIPAGHGLLAISNRKNPDEMTFTINNIEHKIGPYQLRLLPLRPGHYTWTASWPGKHSRNGIADIALGQVAYPVVER
jgi:TolB protein